MLRGGGGLVVQCPVVAASSCGGTYLQWCSGGERGSWERRGERPWQTRCGGHLSTSAPQHLERLSLWSQLDLAWLLGHCQLELGA